MRRPFASPLVLPALLALLIGAAACTHAAGSPDSGSSQVIFADEIERSRAVTAYDAVSKLRHNFLSDRGRTSVLDTSAPRVPNVYLDGMPYGPLSSLNNIPAQQVASIRLYRAWEAQYKYGSDNPAGVIEVTTKRE
jgi:hypothetical protein